MSSPSPSEPESPAPLACASSFVCPEEIRHATFVRSVEIHDELSSTNDRALALARDERIELPALIVARHQTAGRGRGAHRWWAADGALTISLLVDARQIGSPALWPQLSLTAALALCDAVEPQLSAAPTRPINSANSLLNNLVAGVSDLRTPDEEPASQRPATDFQQPARPALGIKWPNDVIYDGRKLGGVLAESPGGSAPAKDRLVIGIGVNINNSWRDSPPEIIEVGTALCDIIGAPLKLQNVLVALLQALEHRLTQVVAQAPQLPPAWQRLCILKGRTVRLDVAGQIVEGQCVGISTDGALLVDTSAGPRSLYSASIQDVS